MITLTKEWLQQTIAVLEEERDATPGAVNEDAAKALAAMKIALASLEAEAVAWIVHARTGDQLTTDGGYVANAEGILGLHSTPLYTAPPAPMLPEEMPKGLAGQIVSLLAHNVGDKLLAKKIWNACRAAMLQGVEPVTTAYKLPEGWVAVPVEPTEDMIVNGFESEPDESFSDEKEWEEYEAMSGCQQAAHRAKLCWAAMIATAPKV